MCKEKYLMLLSIKKKCGIFALGWGQYNNKLIIDYLKKLVLKYLSD